MNRSAALFLAAAVLAGSAAAQYKTPEPESLGRLDLSMEVATSDDDGYPSALRITVRNIGGTTVDMPVLKQGCSPDNGFRIESSWSPDRPGDHGFGSGWGCGVFDGPGLMYRVEHDWVRLRPGESMTTTERLLWTRHDEDGPGTVEYWAEYTPPAVTEQESAKLLAAGYVIPTEKLETTHATFHVQ